jgi:hypothetical protein
MPPILPLFLQSIDKMILTIVAVITGVSVAAISFLRKKKVNKGDRRMSFNSQAMIHGAFPPEAKVATPIINVAMMFVKCPSFESVKKHYTGLMTYDRFRSIPLEVNGVWIFRSAPSEIEQHIICSTVETESDMKVLIDKIVAEELPSNLPYWRVHRIETKSGLSCILTRLHHVIADGISLVAAINKVFCDENFEPLKTDLAIKPPAGPKLSIFEKVYKLIKAVGSVLYIGISPFDSNISFTSPDKKKLVMTSRKTLYFPTIKLEFIKQLKSKAGVTVNDILLSATSGAIRRYSQFRGDDLSGKIHNRALVPLAFFRPLKDLEDPVKAMSNKFAFLSVDLPMNAKTADERIKDCFNTMSELKTSPVALVQLWVQSKILSLLPLSLQRQVAYDSFTRHSMVFSNVPGPNKVITLGGEKVVNMQVIFPNLLPQVILVSYCDAVFMCMVLDGELVVESEKLCQFYLDELKEVASKYNISNSDDDILCKKSVGGEFEVSSV